jgi:hypothetical protein
MLRSSPPQSPQGPKLLLTRCSSTSSTPIVGPSLTLGSFRKAHPLEGPPGEWLSGGISRRSDGREMKDRMAEWDREWARLAGNDNMKK